jgi:predicted HAD superfamily Cof-like phosphohydrolase
VNPDYYLLLIGELNGCSQHLQVLGQQRDREIIQDMVKELSDLVFVCYQFAAAYGIDLDKAMTLVFESNLSKLDEQGKPIYRADGKVLKGPNYQPPNLADCLPKPQLNYYDTNGK